MKTVPVVGNPHAVQALMAKSERGGLVLLEITAVHAHECRYWRFGTRHGPCTCGALEEWERLKAIGLERVVAE